MSLIPNLPTDEGYQLGHHLARFADESALKHPEIPERCSTCAFRKDTYPNGCVTTLMDGLKCAIERVPFNCHEFDPDSKLPLPICKGWMLMRSETEGLKTDWKFSDEYTEAEAAKESK